MFGYCAPPPGNRKATLAARVRRAGSSAAACASPDSSARDAPRSRSRQTSMRRCSKARRPTCSVWATSASGSSGCARRCAARRSRRALERALAARREQQQLVRARGARRPAPSGASSSTTCALVPPTPSELTPARRGAPPRAQSRSVALTKNGLLAKSISGFGASKCRLGGIWRCRSATTVLIRLATPAAVSRWPMFVLTEPIAQKPLRSVPWRKACVSAATSIGSPSAVPVPCAST